MLTLLFRKMRNTKWMVLCLLVGFIIASAMMSTIPTYMNASLQRMLIKDMESFQLENNVFPGIYSVERETPFGVSVSSQRSLVDITKRISADRFAALDVPKLNSKMMIQDNYLYVSSIDITPTNPAVGFSLFGVEGIEKHINITQGRMYSKEPVNGVYECILPEAALKHLGLVLNREYEAANIMDPQGSIKFILVGTFDSKEANDTYWSEGINSFSSAIMLDYDLFLNDVLDTGVVTISKVTSKYSIDYHNMDMGNMDYVHATLVSQQKDYKAEKFQFNMPSIDMFGSYADRASRLKLMLWLLQIPTILMLVFYLYMVSQLNVEQEKNEIAVFKSRGASSFQILLIYAMESLILGVATVLIGPFIGMGLCSILGVSNGFLEFVNRPALPIRLTIEAFIYAGIAVCVFFFTTLIPIVPATKVSIVEHKAKRGKKSKKPIWQRAFIDVILIVASVGWLYYYNYSQEKLMKQGLAANTATVNPLMFIASTAFILGAGLFCIRIYPLVIRIIYWIGKRFWSPAAYVSLNTISRSSSGREKFLMVFLILTVSVGVFSANTARAMNRNTEERIKYSTGADISLTESWKRSDADESSGGAISYIEPEFERFENLPGVKEATKVFVTDDGDMKIGSTTTNNINIMSVIPEEFANICWFSDSLLPIHINNYLNALNDYQAGVLLSTSMKDKYNIDLGDTIQFKWGKNSYFDVVVLAFVDYWPSFKPYDDTGTYIDFAVMNFNYGTAMTDTEPYEVWISLEEDADIGEFYQAINDQKIVLTDLHVQSQEIVTAKNDPMLQGLNGALTLGFIITIIVCVIGFLIYWILSIKSRTLQFGILRAMGMSFREVIGILFYEQILVSGVAIVLAIVIGGIASELYVPLYQVLYNAVDRVPPFKVVPLRADYLKLYAVIGGMLLFGLLVLARLISKIKISQALKLGED